MSTETCTIKIVMRDRMDNYSEESVVKDIWPSMYPWFTRRKGINKGSIVLEDGAIEVTWEYKSDYSDDDQ
jgi:hypothetical protein